MDSRQKAAAVGSNFTSSTSADVCWEDVRRTLEMMSQPEPEPITDGEAFDHEGMHYVHKADLPPWCVELGSHLYHDLMAAYAGVPQYLQPFSVLTGVELRHDWSMCDNEMRLGTELYRSVRTDAHYEEDLLSGRIDG